MLIEYTCDDGSRTLAKWPSLALLYWLGRSCPPPPIENPRPFEIYVVPSPVPSDDDPVFLSLVYAATERRWNKTPPYEIVRPNKRLKHGGKKYQARCLEVLKWLGREGDITSLKIEPES